MHWVKVPGSLVLRPGRMTFQGCELLHADHRYHVSMRSLGSF